MSLKPPAGPVHVLVLECDERLATLFYRFAPGGVLRFVLCPALKPSRVKLYTNIPAAGDGAHFERSAMRQQKWCPSECVAERYIDVVLERPGPYSFEYRVMGRDGAESKHVGHFLVEPMLTLGGRELPLDGVTVQTVITCCLGPLSEWLGRLRVSSEARYNMVHFTPVQEIGASRSAYSLRDQLRVDPSITQSVEDLKAVLAQVRASRAAGGLEMLTVCDVVWNHMSPDSRWLAQNPNCAYNLANSGHLQPAFVLDEALQLFSAHLVSCRNGYTERDRLLGSEKDLQRIMSLFRERVLPQLRLWEFLVLDVPSTVTEYSRMLDAGVQPPPLDGIPEDDEDMGTHHGLRIIRLQEWGRHSLKVDLASLWGRGVTSDELIVLLNDINLPRYERLSQDLEIALTNVANAARYERLASDGPHKGDLSLKHPLATPCFARLEGWRQGLKEAAGELCELDQVQLKLVVANNGWIWGGSAVQDFAAYPSRAYLRRDVIAWSDSVKLRYGAGPQDSPELWQHMADYTQQVAELFDGLRIDNCHSTPLHVGEYLIDVARRVNPNLYVMAELFSGCQEVDNVFASRLGITHLIREAMAASHPQELGRLVHIYGGQPIGSFRHVPSKTAIVYPMAPRAIFFDCTHDNKVPAEKFTLHHTAAGAALVSMIVGGCGSTRGVDELVSEQIKVVDETRKYRAWVGNRRSSSFGAMDSGASTILDSPGSLVARGEGFLAVRCMLNELHHRLALEGYSQIYLDHVTENIFVVTRYSPITHRSVVLVARVALSAAQGGSDAELPPPIHTMGQVSQLLLSAIPRLVSRSPGSQQSGSKFIHGAGMSFDVLCKLDRVNDQVGVSLSAHPPHTINVSCLPVGAVLLFQVEPLEVSQVALGQLQTKIRWNMSNTILAPHEFPAINVASFAEEQDHDHDQLTSVVQALSLSELNYVLYRCEEEEEEKEHRGGATYHVPGHGNLVFCGLQGILSLLSTVAAQDNLAHPVCENLRSGNWLMTYQVQRLERNTGTKALARCIYPILDCIGQLPRSAVPAALYQVLLEVNWQLVQHAFYLMGAAKAESSTLFKALALTSVQMYGEDARSIHRTTAFQSLAAGLPHFSHGWMRSWGRDTFIAFRGLLLVTGRQQEAHQTIMTYAETLRHGLIPNLLDGGHNPRYNCRDAVWWFLQAVQDYCAFFDTDILQAPVARKFTPEDKRVADGDSLVMPLHSIIQEAMQKHATGIAFREWNAGPAIDSRMSDNGFNVRVSLAITTGFLHGGNPNNCGTWMDKMGESRLAANYGTPATPRDGANVEIIGLLKSTVRWLAECARRQLIPLDGVMVRQNVQLTYTEWNTKLQAAFEPRFWVPTDPVDDSEFYCHTAAVHRRGIYRDIVGSYHGYTDYQLRPNLCVAMTVAPELFTPERAVQALSLVEKHLWGGMGMRTLDPGDLNYRPNYVNSDDTSDYATSRGFNYHQGPEWLWCVGYFLRAKLRFGAKPMDILAYLPKYESHLMTDKWRGLPEICNENGTFCPDGCPTQAWSSACLLDVLYELQTFCEA